MRYSTLMYWLQKRRKGAAQGEGERAQLPRNDHPGCRKLEWREKWRRSQRRSSWKWVVGFGKRLLATGHKPRWREKFSGR